MDHFVLVSVDVRRTAAFYERVLGARILDLAEWARGDAEYPVLHFGAWKINLHPERTDAAPRAQRPVPGAVDVCLVWKWSIESAVEHLRAAGVAIELGPVTQEGASGRGQSVYFRDPDGSLLELISYS